MQFSSHLSYDAIMALSSHQIASILREITIIIETRIEHALSQFDTDVIDMNEGAIDKDFLRRRRKQDIYVDTVNLIAEELTSLGHKLVPVEQDLDMHFENSSISWATVDKNEMACGLDIEFFPNKVNLRWVLSPS